MASNSSDATLLPDASWTCGMPTGIPSPERGELVLHATLQIESVHAIGKTPYGHRRVLGVKGGSVSGPKLEASVLKGGLDLELTLSNGVVELEQIHVLRATDDSLLYVRTHGVALPEAGNHVRIVADFEAESSSAFAWLNNGTFVGTRSVHERAGVIEWSIYDLSNVDGDADADTTMVQVVKPTDAPCQPMERPTHNGDHDCIGTVFHEIVELDPALKLGASKRGVRVIIPITGGTIDGQFNGTILPYGADYQIYDDTGNVTLDARYVLKSSQSQEQDECVLLRNAGVLNARIAHDPKIKALVPHFEARVDGPYAFLNDSTYLSATPIHVIKDGKDTVDITIFGRK